VSHETASRTASTVTYTGASLSVSSAAAGTVIPPGAQETVLGLTLNQWTVAGIVFGMLTALAGLLVNLYFQRQRLRLEMLHINQAHPDGD
jgi:TRAP-type C4-dicarboxylate transport system permease large subunit